ncbi:MAG TPA: hypothetical protein EYG82_01035 [Sulfurovum sp.]|nr:hypothetical protein [Sulfurovum sp.]
MLKKSSLILWLTPLLVIANFNSAPTKNGITPSTIKSKKTSSKNYDGFIVKYKKSANTKQKSSALKQSKSISSVKTLNVKKKLLLIKSKSSQEILKKMFLKDPDVESFQPNYKRKRSAITPDDTNFDLLWGLHNEAQSGGTADSDMDAPEAWERSKGSQEIVVAVVDTGVDYLHGDLADNMWVNQAEKDGVAGVDDDNNGYVDDIYGYDFASNLNGDNDPDPMDRGSHGTHVAGTIGAKGDNGSGVVGVNWNVSIMALKVERPDGYFWDSDIFEALAYIETMKDRGVNIVAVNASYGGGGGGQADPMNASIQALETRGILFCAAAGNGGADGVSDDNDVTPHFPSSYNATNIIAIAATDKNDALASFSNYGATSVDIAAPGVEIYSTIPRTHTPSNADVFFDDMEGDTSAWVTGGTNNTWAVSTNQELWENVNYPVPSPTHFWSDSPDADYSNNTDSYLAVKDPINLSGYVNSPIYLAFWTGLQIEGDDYDHAYLEFSSDNGTSWTQVADYSGRDWWWEKLSYVIPETFKTATFKFRFHIVTDGSVNFNGWIIDDVGIGTSADDTYGYMQGTSMATPQVAGAVALMASAHPAETALQRKARILNSVDKITGLNNTVVTEGRINLDKGILALKSKNNFTNNNISDILWRSSSTNHLWVMQADGTHSYVNIGGKSSTYAISGLADFNADGITDILWRKGHKNYIWYMHADGTHSYKQITSKSYDVIAVKDFNNDGIADILWRLNDQNNIWYMNADGTYTYKNIGGKSSTYTIVGTGDLNADGTADILWRKGHSNYIWYMHADGTHTYKKITSKSYEVMAVEDFNADGIADILWRKDNNNHIWYMNADGSYTYKNIGTKGSAYSIAQTADYNGDGITDILWRKDSSNYLWYMHVDGSHTYKKISGKSTVYSVQ